MGRAALIIAVGAVTTVGGRGRNARDEVEVTLRARSTRTSLGVWSPPLRLRPARGISEVYVLVECLCARQVPASRFASRRISHFEAFSLTAF